MKVTTQTLENRQIELVIEIEADTIEQALHQAAKKVAAQIDVPGFRRGKAPYNLIVRAVGEKTLYEEMFNDYGPRWLDAALKEADVTPFRPVEVQHMELEPFSLRVLVPLDPIIELGDYASLRVPFQVPEVPQSQVDQVLDGLRQRNMIVEPAGDGPAEWGHVAVLEVAGQTQTGQTLDFSGLADESGAIQLLLDQQQDPFLPGFAAHIVGLSVGAETRFSLPVPDDFDNQDLRGQTIEFTVQLVELKKIYLPPLDDALAQTVGNYETLEQLRASLYQMMVEKATAQAEAAYADECIVKLAEMAHVEFPPVLAEEELERLIAEISERLKSQKMSLDEMLNIKHQSKEEYRAEMRPRAETRLRQALVLGAFVRAEHLIGDDPENDQLVSQALARLVAICKGNGAAPAA